MSEDIWVPGDPIPNEMLEHSFVSWVTDRIAISSFALAMTPEALDEDGIECIVSIGFLAPPSDGKRTLKHFPSVKDGTYEVDDDIIKSIVTAILHCSSKGKTLVHCAAGVSRSPAFVALFLAIENGWDWERAKSFVKNNRSETEIHSELDRKMKDWLSVHKNIKLR